eukprot:5780225-Prymnesium_polylepis.1
MDEMAAAISVTLEQLLHGLHKLLCVLHKVVPIPPSDSRYPQVAAVDKVPHGVLAHGIPDVAPVLGREVDHQLRESLWYDSFVLTKVRRLRHVKPSGFKSLWLQIVPPVFHCVRQVDARVSDCPHDHADRRVFR